MQTVLESAGYRSLFECVQKEGVEPILELILDMGHLPDKKTMVQQAIMNKVTDLDKMCKKHQNIIKCLKERKGELNSLDFMSQDLYNTLMMLRSDDDLCSTYLENAKKLESLNVGKIRILSKENFILQTEKYYCEVYKEGNRTACVRKCYTDGEVYKRLRDGQEINNDFWPTGYSQIDFVITNKRPCTFVLTTSSDKPRKIDIMDFAFDGSKLPTEEEIQSREIPKSLIKNANN